MIWFAITIFLGVGFIALLSFFGYRLGFRQGYNTGLLLGFDEADCRYKSLMKNQEQKKIAERREQVKKGNYLKLIQ